MLALSGTRHIIVSYIGEPKGTILVALSSQMHIPGRMPRGYVFNTNAMCLEDLGWMKEISKNMKADFTLDGGRFLLSGEIGNYFILPLRSKKWQPNHMLQSDR
jgi:hypothetical protein